MDSERGVLWVTVSSILLVIILSGPLVGALDFTSEQPPQTSAAGASTDDSLTVSVLTIPSTIPLEHTNYGSDSYALRVPAASVHVVDVHGNPPIIYRVSIPELGFAGGSLSYPRDYSGENMSIPWHRQIFGPDQITQREYTATLTLVTRTNSSERVLAERNATVVVTE